MNEICTCTLVLEYNYSKPGVSLGSVWLFNGDGASALENTAPLDTLPNWFKVAGPVDYELANAIHAALKKFFEQSGVAVIDEGIAD
jgi:hypothetical protein